jgi:hypothetical protein
MVTKEMVTASVKFGSFMQGSGNLLVLLKVKLVSGFILCMPFIFGAVPILVLDESITYTGLWRMTITALMSVIGVLLGIVYRDWRRRLESMEWEIVQQRKVLQLLIALSVSLHPEKSKEVLEAFREISVLLQEKPKI